VGKRQACGLGKSDGAERLVGTLAPPEGKGRAGLVRRFVPAEEVREKPDERGFRDSTLRESEGN